MRISTILLLLASSFTWAEISSLSSEELTDTYIKDTTVIVRQPKQAEPSTKVPVKLKVTPLEQAAQVLPEDQTHQVSSISHELSTYDDLNSFRALDNDIQIPLPATTTEFLKAPLNDDLISLFKNQLGVDITNSADLTNEGFNVNLANNINSSLPVDSLNSISANEQSFTLTIPNNGNFNSQQIQSPNGEIAVNVTPSQIQYTINLPK
jgi:hypothetical protein